jgi:hypothetical protein
MSTTTKLHQTQVSCTSCVNYFIPSNNGLTKCQNCYQSEIDYTINFGNQTRILQIDVALMNISFELKLTSSDRKDVLEKLVSQLEKEKLELSKNV